MRYTNKNKKYIINKNNKTKKVKKGKSCELQTYFPFEKQYSKTLPKRNLKITNKKNIEKFISLMKLKHNPKILPQNDFYTYINYTWLDDKSFDAVTLKKEQKYITEVDSFRLVQDNVMREMTEIIVDYIKNNKNDTAKRLNNFFKSAVTRTPIKTSKIYVKNIIDKIEELRKDKSNLWKMLALVNKFTYCKEQTPFCWNINHNLKNSSKFMTYLNPAILPIVDLTVYVSDNKNKKYKENYKKQFFNYCKSLFNTTLGHNNGLDIEGPFKITQIFYNFFNCNDSNIVENPVGFNVLSPEEALEKYNFNWEEFCKELGYQKIPSTFCCTSLNYLKCCTDYLIENWNTEEMKSYWYWLFLREYARFTDHWVEIFYNFYGKFSKGEEVLNPKYASNVIYVSYAFTKLLCKLYAEKYYDYQKVQYVKGLAEDLKEVFIRILKRNSWLDNKTKQSALLKLEKLKFIFVQSDNMLDDPVIDYDPHDFLGNMIKISDWNTKKLIKLTDENFVDLPLMYWSSFPAKLIGKQSYVVNAYYIPQQNSMFIPLAYMQKPFIDLENRGIEYNLSQIGFTIAHELSHSLDSTGSQYDENGNLNNWWSENDKLKYQKIQQNIIKQYDEWTKRDGLVYDATIGIEEDLADISGLAICEEYLRDFQIKNKMIMSVRDRFFNIFYIDFAYQNRQKIGKKALLVELKTDPHPLVKYRTNIPLSRSETFAVNYDIKKGDGMYWPDRSTIW